MSDSCKGVKKAFVKNNNSPKIDNPIKGVEITDRAAEKLLFFLKQDNKSFKEYGLHIAVSKDGCSGMSYKMDILKIENCVEKGAKLFNKNDAIFMIDKTSYIFVIGSYLDYIEALTGSGFTLTNPNAKKHCSCGASFSV